MLYYSGVVVRLIDIRGELRMDLNVRAFRTVQEALKEKPDVAASRRAASRKGGLAGGPSRAKAISAERRLEIARKANAARWRKNAAR